MELDLFRRQYLFGPRAPRRFAWPTRNVAHHVFAAHPELPVNARSDDRRGLLCVGEFFDAENPELTNDDVAGRLFERFYDFRALEAATETLGGRWSIVARDESGTRIYPDAAGSLPIHYAEIDGQLWVSSLPSLLALECGLEPDGALIAELGRQSGAWWPGAMTPFARVRHSWPNHYLDVDKKHPQRYWPKEAVASVDVDSAAREIRRLLAGILRAAARRYRLHLALTGGYDSRTLLAVARPLHSEIRAFTMGYPGIAPFDVETPRLLAERFALSYSLEPYDEPPAEFLAAFDRLAAEMVSGQCRLNAYSYRRFEQEALFVEGSASEVIRCYYSFARNEHEPDDAASLATLVGFGLSQRAEEALGDWLSQAPRAANVDLADLFFWEQCVGNWNAIDYQTQECVRRVFSPFNCRRLLSTGLGTPRSARQGNYPLHRRICELTLPEVLEYGFNKTDGDPSETRQLSRHEKVRNFLREKAKRRGSVRRVWARSRRAAGGRRTRPGSSAP